jgi:hypothetical protein
MITSGGRSDRFGEASMIDFQAERLDCQGSPF